MNQYIQTSSIPAADGTVGIFIGGSQALVLGTTAASVSLGKDDFGVSNNTLSLNRNGESIALNENTLAGGEVPGLLRFQNQDMAEARNLLGRYTLAVTTSMNDQHTLGLDMDGNVGGNLFSTNDFTSPTSKVFNASHVLPATSSNSAPPYTLALSLKDSTRLAASEYTVTFASATGGSIGRSADNTQIAFDYDATSGQFLFQTGTDPAGGPYTGASFDGLNLSTPAGTGVVAGDRFALKPFSTAADNINSEFSSPRALAVASPITGKMGGTNTGSLQLAALAARDNPAANTPVTLTFTGSNSYIRSDDPNYANYPLAVPLPVSYGYVSGTAIESNLPNNYPTTPYTFTSSDNWSVTLQGEPKAGDTFQIGAQPAAFRNLNSGNASAMMSLRDVPTFDGAAMTDGYAGVISQIGLRTQSANYTAGVSSAIANSLEQDRTGVSGVNLDEEAAKLLQYQQAYQASAKVIQIAQGIFDTLMQTVSR